MAIMIWSAAHGPEGFPQLGLPRLRGSPWRAGGFAMTQIILRPARLRGWIFLEFTPERAPRLHSRLAGFLRQGSNSMRFADRGGYPARGQRALVDLVVETPRPQLGTWKIIQNSLLPARVTFSEQNSRLASNSRPQRSLFPVLLVLILVALFGAVVWYLAMHMGTRR